MEWNLTGLFSCISFFYFILFFAEYCIWKELVDFLLLICYFLFILFLWVRWFFFDLFGSAGVGQDRCTTYLKFSIR